jgi:BolA family transcriptional regulator, general stress-responsive regulator
MMNAGGVVAKTLRTKLEAAFSPLALDIVDESARHAGHAGARLNDDGTAAETHFRVRIVSSAFAGLSRVERQRRVYAVLSDELASGVHALALTTLTPEEASR